MTRYMNRWTAVIGWMALMAAVWALFVPRGLSVGTFTLLSLTGLVLLVSGSVLWSSHRPSPSVRQMRAELDTRETARTGARISG